MEAQIITMSTKGQIALPISMRKALGLETGSKLMAFSSGDAIVLKAISLPSDEEMKAALDETQKWAKENGLNEEDIGDMIRSARAEKK
ncbi:MAG: AbrB/MazE/SpoVT family DNA-binding domain-containing protein [Clostridia bacterium]|nr:AbrB/MazE/SpoVT family DNA-binding domain-containing protein [Clostridia bacterium]